MISPVASSSSSSSETSPPNSLKLESVETCQVCAQRAHGKHFGAVTCRACAAFFRRAGVSNGVKPCKRENNCVFLKNGWFNCKKCRLQKCWDVGMTAQNFQFDRDSFCPKNRQKSIIAAIQNKIPETMDTFLGRSNLIIFCAPQFENGVKSFIDVGFLVAKASEVVARGAATPTHSTNSLSKLALGLRAIRGAGAPRSTRLITRIGRDETFALWQEDMLKVATWITYFQPFQSLPHYLQIEMLKGIWKVWSRLENLAVTTIGRRQRICDDQMIMVNLDKDQLLCDIRNVEIDMSWCSKYTVEQLKFFVDANNERRLEELIQSFTELEPSDVELSYMMCQLCFHYIGKRFGGDVLEAAERFLEIVADDLHDYYVREIGMAQYSRRVAAMMKINNHIQQDIYRGRVNSELASVFDIFYVEFSHPEMFFDTEM